MKKVLVCAAVCLVPFVAIAQRTPESFLSALPGALAPCGNTQDALGQHAATVTQLARDIQTEMDRLKAAANARAESQKQKMGLDMAAKAGVSADLMKKVMAGEELTEAEEKALQEQALAKYGISSAEAQKLEKMSDKGRENWAKAYSADTEAKAQASAVDPKAAAKLASEGKAAGNVMALMQEQQTLLDRVALPGKRATDKKRQIEADPEMQRILKTISSLQAERGSLIGVMTPKTESRFNAINAEIRGLEKDYCGRFGPKHQTILAEELTGLKAALPDYQRLDQVQAELEKAQAGASFTQPGLMALDAIRNFVGRYDPMKYDLVDMYADPARVSKARK